MSFFRQCAAVVEAAGGPGELAYRFAEVECFGELGGGVPVRAPSLLLGVERVALRESSLVKREQHVCIVGPAPARVERGGPGSVAGILR